MTTIAKPAPPKHDPITARARLCDNNGMVRRGVMHHGVDYPCTGHAHYARQHIECTNPAHRPAPPKASKARPWHWSPTVTTIELP